MPCLRPTCIRALLDRDVRLQHVQTRMKGEARRNVMIYRMEQTPSEIFPRHICLPLSLSLVSIINERRSR